MFENLTERLSRTLRNVSGRGRLTEENIKETLREVRMALLEADVALPVVRDFVARVKERAVGQEVAKSLSPGQAFIKIVHGELVSVMGEANEQLNLAAQPPAIILMAGLQGAGKTTTVGKLAKLLKERSKKKVLVVSADVYRPAAIKQLETLANDIGVDFFPSDASQKPVDIANAAIDQARKKFYDVVIVDTAGRLHVDSDMMDEIKHLHATIKPVETLFVVDAMTGQDAANTAKAFGEALPLTGVVLTKVDGDARGGAALSVRAGTGKPIKFIGMGEKSEALEPFHPDRIASRILGMGDVLTLVEKAQSTINAEEAEELALKMEKASFDLEDFRTQMRRIKKLGSLDSILKMIPGMGGAMDLVTGAKHVIVAMEHATKEGGAKILKRCNLPLTAAHKVSAIATELAFFRFIDGKLTLTEIAPGVSLDEIRAKTEAEFIVSPTCCEMKLPAGLQ